MRQDLTYRYLMIGVEYSSTSLTRTNTEVSFILPMVELTIFSKRIDDRLPAISHGREFLGSPQTRQDWHVLLYLASVIGQE
jgi:hypothetical protein